MNKIKLIAIIFAVTLTIFLAKSAFAAATQFTINLEQKDYPSETEINVPININSSNAYNAFTLNIEFENLEFIDGKLSDGWTLVNGPTKIVNTVTITAAMLGKDKLAIGDNNVVTLKFKTLKEGNFALKGNGKIALTDENATQIRSDITPTTYKIASSITSPKPAEAITTSDYFPYIIGVGAVILIVVIYFGLKFLRPGNKI